MNHHIQKRPDDCAKDQGETREEPFKWRGRKHQRAACIQRPGHVGLSAPEILAAEPEAGWVLTEDFGNDRMRDWLDLNPADERAAYEAAVEALAALHRLPPGPFPAYDMAVYAREAALLTEWYCPAHGLAVDAAGYAAAWEEALAPLLVRQNPGVTVLRDYHAENIMLLGSLQKQGLLDFQDALNGHRAYDLVSLLQDARRDVPPEREAEMFNRYVAASGLPAEEFLGDYAVLGAQRNTKIVGIFVRLWKRDGKPRYLADVPRFFSYIEAVIVRRPELAELQALFSSLRAGATA